MVACRTRLSTMLYASSIWSSLRVIGRVLVLGALLAFPVPDRRLPSPSRTIRRDSSRFRGVYPSPTFLNSPLRAPIRIPRITNFATAPGVCRHSGRNPCSFRRSMRSLHASPFAIKARTLTRKCSSFSNSAYGAIDSPPGQMLRGLNQQYTWRGPDTEISLTYQANRDRGFIFIESRNLAPRFQDRIADTAE